MLMTIAPTLATLLTLSRHPDIEILYQFRTACSNVIFDCEYTVYIMVWTLELRTDEGYSDMIIGHFQGGSLNDPVWPMILRPCSTVLTDADATIWRGDGRHISKNFWHKLSRIWRKPSHSYWNTINRITRTLIIQIIALLVQQLSKTFPSFPQTKNIV